MNIVDTLGEKPGNRLDLQLGTSRSLITGRNGIGDDNLGKYRLVEALNSRPGQDAMRRTGIHFTGALTQEDFRSRTDCTRRINDIIHKDSYLATDVANNMGSGSLIGTIATLVNDGKRSFNTFRVSLTGSRLFQ